MAMERSASLPFICRTLEEGTQLGDGGRRGGLTSPRPDEVGAACHVGGDPSSQAPS